MKLLRLSVPLLTLLTILGAPEARAFFVDGEGHYGLRGETRTSPAFSKRTGTYQAIEQTFRLRGEARFNDQSSMYLEFRLFDNPREAYLGDKAEPRDCPANTTGRAPEGVEDPSNPCEGEHQNSGEPGYQPYDPKITKAYVRYAFDYCIVEAGRRGRNWGLGIFMDAGDDPFETDASLYDGVTCNVNIQKTQTLGFSVGYDKLAETGTYVDPADRGGGRRFGANDTNDDLDQYFFTIEYDDRKANAGAAFTKQVGVYFAQINSRGLSDGGANTDLKFMDLYTGFYFADFAIRNEMLFRMGKSADPNWQALGGEKYSGGEPATNKLDSIALAGSLEWTMSRSGGAIGPVEYNKGDASRHVMFLNYAYAPGDKDGYFNDDHANTTATDAAGNRVIADEIRNEDRDDRVTAVAFHRNFKPALLLFNQRPEADELIVDGVFNPSRVVNATVLGTGYRFESMENGNFEAKLVTARLNYGIDGKVEEFYERRKECKDAPDTDASCANYRGDEGKRPAGYYGRNLGIELDLAYSYKIGREAELGVAAAAALPGDAWKTEETTKPSNDFLLQSYVNFRF